MTFLGGIVGLVSATLLVAVMLTSHSMDPRSIDGILHVLTAAGISVLAGGLTTFLPHPGSRAAILVLVGILGLLGMVGAVIGDFVPFVWGFVMAPSCGLGHAAMRRYWRRPPVSPAADT